MVAPEPLHAVSIPYKSVAAALLFCALLGPVGLLYATFWGGVVMILLGLIVCSNQMIIPIVLLWIGCCIWGVRSVESHNKKLTRSFLSAKANY